MPHRRSRPTAAGVVLSACLAAALLAGCTEDDERVALVERVIDGDTVVLSGVGTTRLIGVNAPDGGRCGDNAATRFTRRRLEDKRVKYELGQDRRDAFRRTLAYLRRDGTMQNLALVEEGYAKALTIAPNTKYAQRFEAAEKEAKQQERGPLAECAQKREEAREEAALGPDRAKERGERAEQADELARKLRAAEKRAKEELRRAREGGDGAGGDGSRSDRSRGASAPRSCRGVRGWIPTPRGDPTNLDRDNDGRACESTPRRKVRRVSRQQRR